MTATAGRKPNFKEIKRKCDGMMRAECYERIYDTALEAGGGTFVEIGTAHAASAVCLALALRDSGKDGHLYTFDLFHKGGRQNYKSRDNQEIAQDNLAHFGVEDYVTIVPGNVNKTLKELKVSRVDLMMLDCDGRIDRDFALLFDKIPDGAPIIIDDCAERCRVRIKAGSVSVDQKHKLTWRLAGYFEDKGLILADHMEYQTLFATKVPGAKYKVPSRDIITCYAELIRSQGEII